MAPSSLAELASLTQADLAGDPQTLISRVRPFEAAGAGDLTLAADPAYLARLAESPATAFIVPVRLPADITLPPERNYLRTSQPKLAFARALQALHAKPRGATGIAPTAVIGNTTIIGVDPSIHPHVVIGARCRLGDRVTLHAGVVLGDDVVVGDDTVIYANVSIYDETQLGARVIIHSGAVLGADGFGFVPDEQGRHYKILQLGNVVVEDDVEIGANCCIDRATFGSTILRRGVKLDNLIQVAHNCALGEDTVVAAQVGFSGSTTVGRQVIIAGQAATNQHVTIGDRAIVGGQTGVTKSVPPGKFVAGTPAQEHTRWKRAQVLVSRLPELFDRLKQVEAKLNEPASATRPPPGEE